MRWRRIAASQRRPLPTLAVPLGSAHRCLFSSWERARSTTGSLQGDVRALLTQLEIAAMQAALHKAFITPFEAVVERAKANHRISSSPTTGDPISALVGPLFYRRWFSKQKLNNRFIVGIMASCFPKSGSCATVPLAMREGWASRRSDGRFSYRVAYATSQSICTLFVPRSLCRLAPAGGRLQGSVVASGARCLSTFARRRLSDRYDAQSTFGNKTVHDHSPGNHRARSDCDSCLPALSGWC